MKTIKMFFIAIGLLGISSAGFASTVSFGTGSTGSEGEIFLTLDQDPALFSGGFNGTTSVFYDLTVEGDGDVAGSVGSFNITTSTFEDVWLYLYEDGAGATDGLFDEVTFFASGLNSIVATLSAGTLYFLQLTGTLSSGYSAEISIVPLPAAGILFASVLLGAGALGRRKKKVSGNAIVGAFARTA